MEPNEDFRKVEEQEHNWKKFREARTGKILLEVTPNQLRMLEASMSYAYDQLGFEPDIKVVVSTIDHTILVTVIGKK